MIGRGHNQIISSETLTPEVLAEALPLVAYAADAAGRVTHVNRHWLEYTGCSINESLGLAGLNAVHADDTARVLESWQRAVATRARYEAMFRLRRADDSYRWHLSRAEPLLDADGAMLGWVGTATDIHDLHAGREAQAFSTLVRAAPFGLYVVDADLRFIEVSAGARPAFTAYEPLIGRDFESVSRAIWPQPIADDILMRFRHTLESGEPYRFRRTTERRADRGAEESYEWTLERIPLPQGGYGVACHFYDLTERHRNEANTAFLNELDERLRECRDPDEIEAIATRLLGEYLGADRCLVALVSGGRALVQRDWSPGGPSAVGLHDLHSFYTPSAVSGIGLSEVRVVDDVREDERTRAGNERFAALRIAAFVDVPLFSDGALVGLIAVQRSRAHRWRSDEVQVVRDAAARMWPEIERARAVIALEEGQARYQTLFNSVDDGFCICELLFDSEGRATDYRFLEVNPSFARQAGVVQADGRTAYELVGGLEGEWVEVFERVVNSGEPLRFERGSAAMGRVFDMYACRVGGEGSARFAVLFRDVTGERSAQRRLEEINEAQRRFVNDAAHELRAPLTAIRGNLSLLRRYPGTSDAERNEMLGDAEREAARLTRLIADLLVVARGEAKQMLEPEAVRLERCLSEAWRMARALGAKRRFERGQIEPMTVRGDADALQQLLVILLENAVKYSTEGGLVRLEAIASGEWAEVRVWNEGAGIEPEDLERVFERFYRTDRARSRASGTSGTGLGLTIARQIAERHGGQVWLESQPGSGTTAVLRLPLET